MDVQMPHTSLTANKCRPNVCECSQARAAVPHQSTTNCKNPRIQREKKNTHYSRIVFANDFRGLVSVSGCLTLCRLFSPRCCCGRLFEVSLVLAVTAVFAAILFGYYCYYFSSSWCFCRLLLVFGYRFTIFAPKTMKLRINKCIEETRGKCNMRRDKHNACEINEQSIRNIKYNNYASVSVFYIGVLLLLVRTRFFFSLFLFFSQKFTFSRFAIFVSLASYAIRIRCVQISLTSSILIQIPFFFFF